MDVFEALADPVRRAVLQRLTSGPARVADIAVEHPISRPAISRHLRVLAEAGLVRAEDRGRERHYRVSLEPFDEVRSFLATVQPSPPIPESAMDALATEVVRTRRQRGPVSREESA
ncbi:MAG TPA: metalloregulator ArsR/SmtB family transcription factor [Aldersonia sp.]